MTAAEFEARIVGWVRSRPDVVALVQIGSRVQANALVDAWSDWDYHLIVRDQTAYKDAKWLGEIGPCWSAHSDFTERGVIKLSAIFVGGWEVDFIPLSAWRMKLVYWAMARPGLKRVFPEILRKGVANTQLVVAPGYRVIVGGREWEKRLSALSVPWLKNDMTARDFTDRTNGFWRHAVWVHKKIMRGETRAALRWMHREVSERRWILLEEEARIAGRPSRPEARKAEQWLDGRRLPQTAILTDAQQPALARALIAEIELFEEVSRSVAKNRGFIMPDYSTVAAWIRAGLSKLASAN